MGWLEETPADYLTVHGTLNGQTPPATTVIDHPPGTADDQPPATEVGQPPATPSTDAAQPPGNG